MIEHKSIEGRSATIVYLKSNMTPASKDDHDMVKVIFDDGEIVFLKAANV